MRTHSPANARYSAMVDLLVLRPLGSIVIAAIALVLLLPGALVLAQDVEETLDEERVHYVILTSRPLEDPTVVGWPKKVIFQPTSGGVPDGPGSRSLL
jgi:hypothetical protein